MGSRSRSSTCERCDPGTSTPASDRSKRPVVSQWFTRRTAAGDGGRRLRLSSLSAASPASMRRSAGSRARMSRQCPLARPSNTRSCSILTRLWKALATNARARPSERNGVFLSVDMEGMAGVVHLHQVMRGMPEYERSCRLMTAETNAAVAGARRAGATRFLVNDSHGDMRNFLLDELDDGVELISGADKTFSMGAGVDPTFELAFIIG